MNKNDFMLNSKKNKKKSIKKECESKSTLLMACEILNNYHLNRKLKDFFKPRRIPFFL